MAAGSFAACNTCLSQAAGGSLRHGRHTPGCWQRSPVAWLRDDGPSTSGRVAGGEVHRAARRGSARPVAFVQSSREHPGWSQQQGPQEHPELPSSSSNLGAQQLPVPLQPATAAAAAAAAAGALVQEQGGASLLQLVAAWDQLAARLPPQAGAGRGAELILNALKLALAYAVGPGPASSSSSSSAAGAAELAPHQLARPAARALSLAARLADLAAAGLPIDAESIAAGILAEVLLAPAAAHHHHYHQQHASAAGAAGAAAASTTAGSLPAAAASSSSSSRLTLQVIEERVGPIVAQLVHDIQRARQLPARVELLDDTAASALRELCLSFYDVRATAVEIVSRLDALCSPGDTPSYEQQVSALEALQMYAPMGHALGLGVVAAQLEDRCFQILFPESYLRTAAWLREETAANADVLEGCQAALRAAVEAHPRWRQLAGGLTLHGRTKSLFSTLKKLLRLGNTAAGGRARAQLYDLMGLRAIVQPRPDLPPAEAEQLAAEACYLVRQAACQLWECLEGRSKDYIAAPKPNGYQSLHSTVRVRSQTVSLDLEGQLAGADLAAVAAGASSAADTEEGGSFATLELQIRTQAMHERAEGGEAAHGAYKGGLDAAQALQLKSVTEAVLRRTAAAAAAGPAATAAASVSASSMDSSDVFDAAEMASSSGSSDAAAEGLFRHLDQNGDGRISLEELQFALQELGVSEAQAQSRAATELLQLATASEDSADVATAIAADVAGAEEDGTIGFEAFMAFQRRVGLLQAISAVDHQQASLLEQQHQQHLEAGGAGAPWGAGGSGSRLAAGAVAACRAHSGARGMQLGWQQPCGSGRWGSGCQQQQLQRAVVMARAFVETSSAYSSSSSSSLDSGSDDEEAASSSSSHGSAAQLPSSNNGNGNGNNGNGNGNGTAAVVTAAASNHSAVNGNGSTAAAAERQGLPLLSKPQRPAAPPEQPAAAPAAAAQDSVAASPTAGTDASVVSRREATAVWQAARGMAGILRLVSGAGPPPADATWHLVPAPSNPHRVLNAAGDPLPEVAGGAAPAGPAAAAAGSLRGRLQTLRLPEHGPCVIGALRDSDCDYVVDVPTVSGRHLRLEVVRQPGANVSKLVVMDLGSTNGTRINRTPIQPFREVRLRPGDVLCLAEQNIAFEVQVVPPAPAVGAASNVATASAAAVAAAPPAAGSAVDTAGSQAAAAATGAATASLPVVVVALRIAGVLEAAAAEQGHFPPGGAVYADLPDRARQLMGAGRYGEAHALLLAGVQQQPWSGGLWAQLANLERQRARRRERGASYGIVRAFYGAAAACFAAISAAGAGGAQRAAAERAEGLARVFSSWAQLEISLRNWGPARTLFSKAVAAACEHPVGAAAGGAARLLFTWAHCEWKEGEAAVAQRLCVEALEVDPSNAYVLTLLGNIEAEAGQVAVARSLFERALAVDASYATALQSWGRLEATSGSLQRARELFRRALRSEPLNTHVLQAWAVAEAKRGNQQQARSLFRRCTEADPSCRVAWHAWGKLEDEAGRTDAARQLYRRALELNPTSPKTLSALGCLERRAGRLEEAEAALEAALAADPRHAPSLHELALLRELQGRDADALQLKRRVRRMNANRRASLKEIAAKKLPASVASSSSTQPAA